MDATITCRPIRLQYFLGMPNVGDRINPSIVTALSGQQTVHVRDDQKPQLLATGSIMAAANPLSHVWGTGVLHPNFGIGSVAAHNIHALRGKLTHSVLSQAGIELSDVPLGDPGFLAPALLGIAKSTSPAHRLGVVPHYVDRANPLFRRLMTEPGIVGLNVHDDPERFLRAMADCEVVVSSSLHGLIFAEALGIPNLWITASEDVVGGPFKFDDWFSTTADPQMTAYALTSASTADNLIRLAALHNSTIDVEALRTAFPHGRLDELRETQTRRILPTSACRSHPVPAFLISFNRGVQLERIIASITRLDRPIEIVVHDTGSTDAVTLAILDKLEANGTRVVRCAAIDFDEALNTVNDTIQKYFSDWAEPCRYIVSDCNIDMVSAAPEALDIYDKLLDSFRRIESVGPMLRIRDIPATAPHFDRAMNWHIDQFWHRKPKWTETPFGRVAYIDTVIDSAIDPSFSLQRAGAPYRRFRQSLRVYEPYAAQLLDLHMDGDALPITSNRLLPFDKATVAQRNDRISSIENLRRTYGTDLKRWRSAAAHDEAWAPRSKLLASYVRPGERVFEFGAGKSVVAAMLPAGCTYTGSDVAPLRDDMMVIDLNAPTLPPQLPHHDVALFSGVLEYVHDLSRLAMFLSRHFCGVVCSYAALGSSSPEEIDQRRYSGWFNDFTADEFSTIFRGAGFNLSEQGAWRNQTLFRWDR